MSDQTAETETDAFPLGKAARGFRGVVHRIDAEGHALSLQPQEIERRLIEPADLERLLSANAMTALGTK